MGAKEGLDKEADELLRNPKILYLVKEDMGRTIKGEDENKLLCWLLELTCRTKDYAFVDVIGESAVGKTNMVRETLRYLPSEWYRKVGRITRTAIDYLKDQDFDLLWIQEVRGGEEAAPSIRLQSADDGGLIAWVTERDKETGKFATNEYHVRCRGIISTTTNVSFSPEDATRTWLISAEASEAQTKRIIEYKLARAKEPPELIEALGRKPKDLAPVVQQALEMLDWDSPVVIPYAEDLTSLFSSRLVRVRRDVDKFLGLIRIIARLHQFQRPIVEFNGKRFIVATASDALIAFQLGAKPLEETLTGLERRLREVYEAVRELGQVTNTSVGVKIHKGSEYARRALRVLVEMGYVDVDESQKTYMYSIRQTENPSNDLCGLQRTFSGSELQKKVESWLTSIASQPLADGENGYYDPIEGNYVGFNGDSYPTSNGGSLPSVAERRSELTSNRGALAETGTQMSSEVSRGDQRTFPTAITIDNVLGWLRLEFQSGHGNQVLSIVPLELTTRGICPLCQKRDVNLVWQIQFLDESRVDACCIDCGGRVQDLVREFEESAS